LSGNKERREKSPRKENCGEKEKKFLIEGKYIKESFSFFLN